MDTGFARPQAVPVATFNGDKSFRQGAQRSVGLVPVLLLSGIAGLASARKAPHPAAYRRPGTLLHIEPGQRSSSKMAGGMR